MLYFLKECIRHLFLVIGHINSHYSKHSYVSVSTSSVRYHTVPYSVLENRHASGYFIISCSFLPVQQLLGSLLFNCILSSSMIQLHILLMKLCHLKIYPHLATNFNLTGYLPVSCPVSLTVLSIQLMLLWDSSTAHYYPIFRVLSFIECIVILHSGVP